MRKYTEPTIQTSQVAQILGKSSRTVIRWADAGKLPCTKTPGGSRRFLVSDIETVVGHPIAVKPIGTYCVDCGAPTCGRKEVKRCHTCAAKHWTETATPAEREARDEHTRQMGLANFGRQYPKEPETAPDGGVIHWDTLGQRKRPGGQVIATVLVECACGHERRVAVQHFERRVHPTQCRTCAVQACARRGTDHPWWKGGFTHRSSGYIQVSISMYTEAEQEILRPMAYNGQVYLHRVVAALTIGRSLTTDEAVHHINEDKTDNRPENLQVMPRFDHGLLHGRSKRTD